MLSLRIFLLILVIESYFKFFFMCFFMSLGLLIIFLILFIVSKAIISNFSIRNFFVVRKSFGNLV